MKMEDKPAMTKPRKAFLSLQFWYDKKAAVPSIDITHNELDESAEFSDLQAMALAHWTAGDLKGTKAEKFLVQFCKSIIRDLEVTK